MLQSAFYSAIISGEFLLVRLRFFTALLVCLVALGLAATTTTGQTPARTPNAVLAVPLSSPAPSPTPARTDSRQGQAILTAADVAEAVIIVYGYGGGRPRLDQIRKTTIERGKTTFTDDAGKIELANYQRYIIRGGSLGKDKIRLDQEFPNARYSLVYNDDKMFGILNRIKFEPNEDAAKQYDNSIFRGLEMLLRFKENESTLTLAGKEKELGVEMHLIDVTDKKGRKARFHVSVKSFQIKAISYEENGVKFKRKFYNHNYAQGTLVPYRHVLLKDGKVIEETEIGTITFGQRVEESLFAD